jgi:hypothetical protein
VVQTGRCLRMLQTEALLADAKGVPVQGLCLGVHRVFQEVAARSVKQIRRLRQQELVVLDQRIARLDLFQVAQARLPGIHVFRILGEDRLHGTHHLFAPGTLHLGFHAIHLDGLDQTMDTQHPFLREPFDQRKGQQGFEHLVKAQEIRYCLTKERRPMRSALCEQFFRDVVRGEEGAELEQFGGCRVASFHLCKRKGPGGGHRLGVRRGLLPPPCQQRGAMLLIEVKIVMQAASCLFNIGTCLIDGERKLCQGNDHIDGFVYLLG